MEKWNEYLEMSFKNSLMCFIFLLSISIPKWCMWHPWLKKNQHILMAIKHAVSPLHLQHPSLSTKSLCTVDNLELMKTWSFSDGGLRCWKLIEKVILWRKPKITLRSGCCNLENVLVISACKMPFVLERPFFKKHSYGISP